MRKKLEPLFPSLGLVNICFHSKSVISKNFTDPHQILEIILEMDQFG